MIRLLNFSQEIPTKYNCVYKQRSLRILVLSRWGDTLTKTIYPPPKFFFNIQYSFSPEKTHFHDKKIIFSFHLYHLYSLSVPCKFSIIFLSHPIQKAFAFSYKLTNKRNMTIERLYFLLIKYSWFLSTLSSTHTHSDVLSPQGPSSRF